MVCCHHTTQNIILMAVVTVTGYFLKMKMFDVTIMILLL